MRIVPTLYLLESCLEFVTNQSEGELRVVSVL
jgi:hypothetical protein